MKQLLILFALFFSSHILSAQNTDCKVLVDSLKGTYEGGCSDGKASGTGKAIGLATYEGEFKNGLPDGKGKYTWAGGDFYYGGWRKGLKDGKGEIHHFEGGKESLITGYWKKGNYKGEYEDPYKIIETGPAVTYKNVQFLGTKKNTVYFSMKSGVMGVANTDVYVVVKGFFQRINQSEMNLTRTIEFQDVQFPFQVRFTGVDRGMVDIIFYESGEWRTEIVF
jgi:hypothetical protein